MSDKIEPVSIRELVDELHESNLPVFVAVVLDDRSHKALLAWWERATGTKLLSKIYAHHMTIKFKPNQSDMDKLTEGEKVTLQVIGWAEDGKVQAVAVKGFKSSNKIPHITVATDGTPPFKSNALLADGFTRVRGPRLTGTVAGERRSK